MRLILALAAVVFSVNSQAADQIDVNWLVENMDGVKVSGSEALALNPLASLQDVLDAITAEENNNLFHMITKDFCRENLRGEGIRCDLLISGRYLIQYRLRFEDGRYQVNSPVRLLLAN